MTRIRPPLPLRGRCLRERRVGSRVAREWRASASPPPQQSGCCCQLDYPAGVQRRCRARRRAKRAGGNHELAGAGAAGCAIARCRGVCSAPRWQGPFCITPAARRICQRRQGELRPIARHLAGRNDSDRRRIAAAGAVRVGALLPDLRRRLALVAGPAPPPSSQQQQRRKRGGWRGAATGGGCGAAQG